MSRSPTGSVGLRVFITGASSGLGAALAREHAGCGHRLALLARREGRLRELERDCRALGAAEVLVLVGDVGNAGSVAQAVGRALSAWGGLDTVYANAGYSETGPLETLALARWRRQMRVNVEGVLITAQASLPALRESGGRLAVVGSVAGLVSTAHSGAYAASKAALRSLAQILDLESRPDGVSVTHVAPGFFNSEIRLKGPAGRSDPKAREYVPGFLLGDVTQVAKSVKRAVERRQRECVVPGHAKMLWICARWAPGWTHELLRKLSQVRLKQRRMIQGR